MRENLKTACGESIAFVGVSVAGAQDGQELSRAQRCGHVFFRLVSACIRAGLHYRRSPPVRSSVRLACRSVSFPACGRFVVHRGEEVQQPVKPANFYRSRVSCGLPQNHPRRAP